MSYNSPNYGFEGDPLMEAYRNAKFSEEISEKMKVPKRLTANGDDQDLLMNGQNHQNSWNYHEKLNMTVPDRIVVIGQDQHLGTKSAPREIMLENTILPKNPSYESYRVQTPPRVITLSEHHFPSASDEPEDDEVEQHNERGEPKMLDFSEDAKRGRLNNNKNMNRNSQDVIVRDGTPVYSHGSIENLSSHDEVLHLRKQVAKMNRRLLNVEIDNIQRMQREKIFCVFGLTYFVLKAFFWLNRK